MSGTLLQRPLVFFVIGGVGCLFVLVAGLFDAVRTWRARLRDDPDAPSVSRPNMRFVGSLIVLAALGLLTFQLFAVVIHMTPTLVKIKGQIGSPLEPVAYLPLGDAAATTESLARFRGRVVLINVWATWCGPCRKEMPDLEQLQQDLHHRGLTVVHLSQESRDRLEGWLLANPMSTRHGQIAALPFPVPALPTSVVLDREGVVRDVMVGGQSYRTFEKAVTPWL